MAETAVERESQVTIQCGRLERNIENAHTNLAALEVRLESVLAPHPPTDAEGKEAEELTLHAAFLRRQANSIQQLIDGLNSLRNRVEL